MLNYECDKCHHVEKGARGVGTVVLPPDWQEITANVRFGQSVTYLVCGNCREKLQIPKIEPQQDMSARLLEIIQDLVTDEVTSQMS